MSAALRFDSIDASHPSGPVPPESGVVARESDSAAPAVRPKAKSKAARPRPCFDDGALTRIFKFPSRAYPRSTYYVTSEEFIIRIKKARKKWKLIVPKKRVVSYKTNRWFAKPRWIELELTYTQASRLGLVEARRSPAATDVGTGLASEPGGEPSLGLIQQLSSANVAEVEVSAGPELVAPPEIETASGIDPDDDQEIGFDAQEQTTDDDKDGFDLFQDHAGDPLDVPLPEPGVRTGDADQPVHTLQLVDDIASDHRPMAVVVMGPQRSSRPERFRAVLWAAALAVLPTCGAVVWLAFGGISAPQPDTALACLRSGAAEICADAPVGGPVVAAAGVLATAPVTPAATDPLPTTEPAVAAKIPEPDVRDEPRIVAEASERHVTWQDVQSLGTGSIASSVPDGANHVNDVPPTVANVASQPEHVHAAPVEPGHCHQLAATAQDLRIYFDYASPQLDRAVLAPLSAFAAGLQSCGSVRVTIEGHTDSDGYEARNDALSWRRAEAVREHMIAAGANPEQLAVIGYGWARPMLPNVSPGNKRRNRRVAVVVEQR
jgi:outer membrane protein OmpA-like peptidoglycan-associated protein